jgi:hypothetical protein
MIKYGFTPLTENSLQPARFVAQTVSVGIRPIKTRKRDGREVLAGRAVKRFKGEVANWQAINAAALAFCQKLNECLNEESQMFELIGETFVETVK